MLAHVMATEDLAHALADVVFAARVNPSIARCPDVPVPDEE